MLDTNLKFLLVDDHPFIRGELISSLLLMDFRGPFVEASDGIEALKAIKDGHKDPFDFIICDVYMPNMDGINFLNELQKNQILEVPTPIMMLTSENDQKVGGECMKLGATNYLLKPWSQIELAKKIVQSWDKIHKIENL